MEQQHSAACIWCSTPENAQKNFKTYCTSVPTSDWANTANENLSHCMDCVKMYHRGRAAVVADQPDLEQVFFLEVPRLRLSLNKCVVEIAREHDDILDYDNEEDVLYSYWGNSEQEGCPLPVPVQEILWFPFYLQDEEVNEVFCCVMKALYKAKQLHVNAVDKPLCGLFMLLIHPNNLISNWARKSVARLGSYVIERCEEFTQVINLMLSVKYLDLFENRTLGSFYEEVPSSRPILSSHLFPYEEVDYWQGLSCFLHWINEENLNHLGSELHSIIICIYSKTLAEDNFKTVDECNSFWDKLVGFQQLIDKLGFRIWQYLKEAPEVVFNSIFSHPCVRSAVNKMKDKNLEQQLGHRLPETSPYNWIRPFVFSLLKYDSIAKDCVTMVLDILINEMNTELTNQTKNKFDQPIENREPSLYIQHSVSSLVEILESLITCNFFCVSLSCFEKCFKIMRLFLMKFQQNQGSSQQFERCHTSLVRFIRKLLNICVKKEISLTESHSLIRNIDSNTDFRDVDYNLLNMCIKNLVEHLQYIRIKETAMIYNDKGASTSTTSEECIKDYCTEQDTIPDTQHGASTSTAFIKQEIQDSNSLEPSHVFVQEDSSLLRDFIEFGNMSSSDSEDNHSLVPRFIKKEIIPCDYVSDDELLLRHGLARKVSVQVKKLTSDDIEKIKQELYTMQGASSYAVPGPIQDAVEDAVTPAARDTIQDTAPYSVKWSAQDFLQNAVPSNMPYAPAMYKYPHYRLQEIKQTNSEKLIQAQKKIKLQKDKLAEICRQNNFPISTDSEGQEAMICTDTSPDPLQDTSSNTEVDVASDTSDNISRIAQDNTSDVSEDQEAMLCTDAAPDALQDASLNAVVDVASGTSDNVSRISQDNASDVSEDQEAMLCTDTAPDALQGTSSNTVLDVASGTSDNVSRLSQDNASDVSEDQEAMLCTDTAPDPLQDASSNAVVDVASGTSDNVSRLSQDNASDVSEDQEAMLCTDTAPDPLQDASSNAVVDVASGTSDNVSRIAQDNTSDISEDQEAMLCTDTAPDALQDTSLNIAVDVASGNSDNVSRISQDNTSDVSGQEAMLCTDTAPDAVQDTSLNTVMNVASNTSSDNISGTAQNTSSDSNISFDTGIHYNFSLDRLRSLIRISREKTINSNRNIKIEQDTENKERTQDKRLIEDQTIDNLPYNVKEVLPNPAPVNAEKTAPDSVQITALDNFVGTSSIDVPRTAKDNTPHISSHKAPIKYSLGRLRDSLASAKKTKNLQQHIVEQQAKRANERRNRMLTAVTPDTAEDTPSTSFAATEIQSPETNIKSSKAKIQPPESKIASQHQRFSSSADIQAPSEMLASCTLTTSVTQKTKLSPATAVQCRREEVNQIPSYINIDLLVAIVLSWKTEWLEKQVFPEQIGGKQKMGLMKVPLTFDSINSYINIFVPLLLRETWYYVLQEYWKVKRIKSSFVDMVYIRHYKISNVKAGCFLVCKQSISSRNLQQTCPCKLDLVILRLNIPGKEAPSYQVFAIVTKAVLQPISGKGQASQEFFTLEIELQVLELDESVLMTCTQEDNNVQIQVVTSMMSHLRLFKCFRDLQKHSLVADILCPRVQPVTQIIAGPHPSKLETKIDICQSEAADKIFTCMETELMIPSISLLHGPPGTGKTRTIINIIERILKKDRPVGNSPQKPGQTRNNMDTRPRILVCAPSNTAVDLLVLNVAKMCLAENHHNDDSRFNCGLYNIVRLGNNMHKKCLRYQLTANVDKQIHQASKNGENVDAEKMRKEISDCQSALQRAELHCGNLKMNPKASHIELKQAEEERDHLHKQLKDLKKKKDETNVTIGSKSRQESILLHADVVFCTLNGSGFNHLDLLYTKRHPHFKYVIVDEACQCTEVDTLIPLQFKGLQLLLVGDPHQLQATVVSEEAKELGFQRSLFERMYKYFKTLNLPVNPVHLLRTQYRMHPEICSFPSKHFYNNELKTYIPLRTIYESFPFKPYLVFDIIEDRGQAIDKDNTNEAECEMVLALVSCLVTIDKFSIGVITPCRQQNILLKDKFKRFGESIGEKIEVGTVDGFQGQGKEVIILSCVRARGSSIGFVADRNRMNVALTRAKNALYIVGHFKSFQMNEDWKELMRDAQQRKVIQSVHIGQYEKAANLCKKIPQ